MTKVLSSRVIETPSTPSTEGAAAASNVTVTEQDGVIVGASVEVAPPESRQGQSYGDGHNQAVQYGRRTLTKDETLRAQQVTIAELGKMNLPEEERNELTAMIFGV